MNITNDLVTEYILSLIHISTMVRQRIGAGDSVEDLVPPQVERYITANGLYK